MNTRIPIIIAVAQTCETHRPPTSCSTAPVTATTASVACRSIALQVEEVEEEDPQFDLTTLQCDCLLVSLSIPNWWWSWVRTIKIKSHANDRKDKISALVVDAISLLATFIKNRFLARNVFASLLFSPSPSPPPPSRLSGESFYSEQEEEKIPGRLLRRVPHNMGSIL